MTVNGPDVSFVGGWPKPILTLGSCVTKDERKGPRENFSVHSRRGG